MMEMEKNSEDDLQYFPFPDVVSTLLRHTNKKCIQQKRESFYNVNFNINSQWTMYDLVLSDMVSLI
jgi:hypothetical protein